MWRVQKEQGHKTYACSRRVLVLGPLLDIANSCRVLRKPRQGPGLENPRVIKAKRVVLQRDPLQLNRSKSLVLSFKQRWPFILASRYNHGTHTC
jgi:hypothetical protein